MDMGGRIWLTADLVDNYVEIRVKDTGIGIPPNMLPRIFDMFTQVDRSMERAEGGLGIGLTLVKRLIELHDGSVEVHSDGPSTGSEFVVRLPVAGTTPVHGIEGDTVNEKTAAQGVARRILVVDDNRDAADSLGMLLRMMGNEVHTAHDGIEAVGAAATFQPDVILLDIGLPKLNGYEAVRRIKEQSGGRNILLIALTGWGQEDDRRRSHEAGFHHHLTKPVDFPALQEMLAGTERKRTD
jgi:CheY-like chemotaxis protein